MAGGYEFDVGISSSSSATASQNSPFYVQGGGGGANTTNPRIVLYIAIAVGILGLAVIALFFRK